MFRLLRHDQSVHREDDGAVRFDDILKNSRRKSSMVLCNGRLAIGYPFRQKEEDKEKVSMLFEP